MLPSFYNPNNCGKIFKPNLDAAVAAGKQYARDNNIPSAKADKSKFNILALIDMQIDFISPPFWDGDRPFYQTPTGEWFTVNLTGDFLFETPNNPVASVWGGNLPVPGAVNDVRRVCEFIYNNPLEISHVDASLDTHFLFQPFHRFNWVAGPNPADGYNEGDHPNPFTVITGQDILNGVWQAIRMPNRMSRMIQLLEQDHKKNLCIWPLHCELGTVGHALDPSLMEAIHWHAAVRNDQYDLTDKGRSQSSEHYGILKAEVEFADDPTTMLNTLVVGKWQQADKVWFAGEARTHCCLETLNQVADIFAANSLAMDKLNALIDCMSNVPDIVDEDGNTIVPFNQIATDRFSELESMGFKFVNSTDPVDSNNPVLV